MCFAPILFNEAYDKWFQSLRFQSLRFQSLRFLPNFFKKLFQSLRFLLHFSQKWINKIEIKLSHLNECNN